MRPALGLVALLIACAGCTAEPEPPPPPFSEIMMTPLPNDPNCREYQAQALVGGQPQMIVGKACLQSDGTWRVVEGTPQNPNQMTMIYPPYPYYGGYGYGYPYYDGVYDPWDWGPPIGFSVGTVFFVGKNGHHDGHHGHGGYHGGYHGGGHGGGGHHS